MSKRESKDVFEKSFENTDFYKKQKELYLINKEKIDNKRRITQEKKEMHSHSSLFEGNTCLSKARYVAIKVARHCKELAKQHDYVILNSLLNQLFRSATSVLANMAEGSSNLISLRDRINKFNLALKEARESICWIDVLYELGEISEEEANDLLDELNDIIRILSKSIYTMRCKQNKQNK